MAQEKKPKISFESFLESVEENHHDFVQNLHEFFLAKDCKVTIEEKKSGFLASYKYGKPLKAVANFLFRKSGMLVRFYGENVGKYSDFLNTLPDEMIQKIAKSGICKRLVNNTCSPKCSGYDFTIGDEHFQKCRYSCFEFLITEESKPYIRKFAEHEIKERTNTN